MIVIDRDTCVLCGLCIAVCPPDAMELTPTELVVHSNCTDCGWCVPYCPVGAISGGRPVHRRPRAGGTRVHEGRSTTTTRGPSEGGSGTGA